LCSSSFSGSVPIAMDINIRSLWRMGVVNRIIETGYELRETPRRGEAALNLVNVLDVVLYCSIHTQLSERTIRGYLRDAGWRAFIGTPGTRDEDDVIEWRRPETLNLRKLDFFDDFVAVYCCSRRPDDEAARLRSELVESYRPRDNGVAEQRPEFDDSELNNRLQ
jgi:hypothetical protein